MNQVQILAREIEGHFEEITQNEVERVLNIAEPSLIAKNGEIVSYVWADPCETGIEIDGVEPTLKDMLIDLISMHTGNIDGVNNIQEMWQKLKADIDNEINEAKLKSR